MPKKKPPLITLRAKSGETLAQVTLPSFCLQHMKPAHPADNLNMMIKHLSSAAKIKIHRLYTEDGKEVTGLNWTQCETDIDFRL